MNDNDMTRWIRQYQAAGEPDEVIAAELCVSLEQVRHAKVKRWRRIWIRIKYLDQVLLDGFRTFRLR